MRLLWFGLVWLAACQGGAGSGAGDTGLRDDRTGDVPPTLGDPPAAGDDGDVPVVPAPPPSPGNGVHRALDGVHTYVLDDDLGEIVVYDDRQVVQRVALGDEPTRLAQLDGDWFVTMRRDGELVRLEVGEDGTLSEAGRSWLGAEPYGLAGSHHRGTLYVALSQENALVAVDPGTLQETGRWTFDGEPRWVITTAQGDPERVFVALADRPEIHVVDPSGAEAPQVVTLPPRLRFADDDCKQRFLTPRISGDPILRPTGDELFVPSLYNDTQLFEDDHAAWRDLQDIDFDPDTDVCEDAGESVDGDGEIACTGNSYVCVPSITRLGDRPTIVGKFNPAVTVVDVADLDVIETILVNGVASRPDASDLEIARGVPSAVAFDEQLDLLWVTMETYSTVVVMSRTSGTVENTGQFSAYRRGSLPVGAGPVAVHLDEVDGIATVWSAIDRTLHYFDVAQVSSRMSGIQGVNDPDRLFDELQPMLRAPQSGLPSRVQEGRRLFFGGDDLRISAPSAGVSCSACHPDGRSDGMTWLFEEFPRQVPSLVGGISDTAPYKWSGTMATAQGEVFETAHEQMGGEELTPDEARMVVEYLDSLRPIERPSVPADLEAQGRALFQARGCDTCHAGDVLTDGQVHRTPDGLDLDTPSLRGVGGTLPYLHDGSAPTLRDVVTGVHAAEQATPSYGDDELQALIAFLETL